MKTWFNRKKEIPVLSPLEGYNLWGKTYSGESNPIKDLSNQLVEQMLPGLNEKAVLDAGCGTGYFCEIAHKKGASGITGVDFSETMIAQAKKNHPFARFICSDITDRIFDHDLFDVVICALVLGHIEDISPVLKNLADYLKPGGEIIITDFHPVLTMRNSKRTFTNPDTGKTLEIKHYLHPLNETETILKKYGLLMHELEEPLYNNLPVIYALKAKKNIST